MNTAHNRRDFLKKSSTATAVTVAPYVFSTRSGRAAAANDRLNIAAIGVGGRGTTISHEAGKLGNMVACADVNSGHAEKFASKYEGRCEIFSDYRKMIDRKDIDAITCGTPDHWHTRIVIDAMQAGKDVYCEKPLTLTIDEGRQIMEVTRRTGRVCQVGTQQRSEHSQVFLKAIAIAQSGRLGDRLHAVCGVGAAETGGPHSTEPAPSQLQWDMWLGQAPVVRYCSKRTDFDFRWWLEYSGGQVTDWGVHHTDIAMWALGGSDTGIAEAEGHGVFPGLPYSVNIIDFLNGLAKLPNQYNVAHTFQCQFRLPNDNTIELNSGKNEIIIEGDKGKLRVNRGGLTGKVVENIQANSADSEWLDEEVHKLYRNMPIESHMENFFHCVRTREMPISDVWTHANSVNACHIANVAMLLKRKVVFDREACRFVSDDEANRFISRKQRQPWGVEDCRIRGGG